MRNYVAFGALIALISVLFPSPGAAADQEMGGGLTDVSGLFEEDGVLTFSPYLGFDVNEERARDQVGVAAGYGSGVFGVAFDVMLIRDDKYTPSEPYMFGHRFRMNEGIVEVAPRPLFARAGRINHADDVHTPYSLFISSADRPAVTAEIGYDDGFFFYKSRWISLTRNWDYDREDNAALLLPDPDSSGFVPPANTAEVPRDRGANYKSYGFQLGDVRFGVQESIVYINQEFYPEYFFSPLPMYFTQLVNSTEGKPWTQIANENSIIGFYLDWTRPTSYAYAQFLIDDINLNALAPDVELTQPNKLAWSLGGRYDFDFGTMGVYHAGATKFLFEAVDYGDEQYLYQYTYYPTVRFERDGEPNTFWYYDNYIGYKYGENNLALMLTYDRSFPAFDLGSSLEYVVSGSKSPANPWHEDDGHPGETQLLDDPELEHRIRLSGEVTRSIDNWDLTAAAGVGYVWNELRLREVEDPPSGGPEPEIFKPVGEDYLTASLFLGGRYSLEITEDDTWRTILADPPEELDEEDGRPLSTDRARYEITEVNYDIDGRTREFALAGRLDIEEGTQFASRDELESYIADRQQVLTNQRVLSDESTLSYTVRRREDKPDAVVIEVDAVDTWNLIALPYPEYDSNDGLLLSVRARDYNFFGTMEELKVNFNYRNKIGDDDQLSGDEVWSVYTQFDWPFQWQGRDWKWNFSQDFELESIDDMEYELNNSLDYDFLMGRRTYTATYSQSYNYLTDDDEGDGYYLTSGLSLGTGIPTGWALPVLGELTYSPGVFTDVDYKLGEKISEARRGIEFGFRQGLSAGRVDWIGNFREGMKGSISNSNTINMYTGNPDRTLDASLAGYLELDPFAFSGRGLIKAGLDDTDYADGGPLRGILDDRFEGKAGAYLNADATLKVWTIGNFVEGQGSGFIDVGAIHDFETDFDLSEDVHASGGIEAIGFPLFARSLYMRISVGFDLKRVLLDRAFDQREIFIGFGH
ncbi:MAG: hypothetical protein ACOCYG_05115, partial [Spirochaetota bacterium]